jgi:hypothetical protein
MAACHWRGSWLWNALCIEVHVPESAAFCALKLTSMRSTVYLSIYLSIYLSFYLSNLSQLSVCNHRLQRRLALGAGLAATAFASTYYKDPKQLEFDAASAAGALVRLMDAESAHRLGIWCAKHRLLPRESRPDPPELSVTVWGRGFANPVGMCPCKCPCGPVPPIIRLGTL